MRPLNNPQVEKSHYTFDTYSSERRYLSYYHQVKNVMHYIDSENAKKILVAGKGDGVVPKILEAYSEMNKLDLEIKTYDFAKDLQPDFLGDLMQIDKIIKEKFDVIICCQVLEHIPLQEAISVLEKMHDISRAVVMSVPYKTITVRGTLKVPILKEFEFCVKIPIWKNKKGMVDSRHYWELGYSISLADFKMKLRSIGYTIKSSYVLKKDGFKYFFVLEAGKKSV